jgi:hypothetical protein
VISTLNTFLSTLKKPKELLRHIPVHMRDTDGLATSGECQASPKNFSPQASDLSANAELLQGLDKVQESIVLLHDGG